MIRNILAVIAGLIMGSLVNGGLINLGHMVVPLPAGADVTTMAALRDAMQNFGPEQFVFPFLAHAVGTLVGAFVAALIAASHKFKTAMGIGVVFLLGGMPPESICVRRFGMTRSILSSHTSRPRGSVRSLRVPSGRDCNSVTKVEEVQGRVV